jgi:hypothetical protein
MQLRVAVDLARRREQEPRTLPLRDPEGVMRAVRPGLQGVQRQAHVVDRARERREVVDEVERLVDPDRLADVVVQERELVAAEMRDVRERARLEVVETDDSVPPLEQRLAEVGAEKPGATGDERRRHRARCYPAVGMRDTLANELRTGARPGRRVGLPEPSRCRCGRQASGPPPQGRRRNAESSAAVRRVGHGSRSDRAASCGASHARDRHRGRG